MTPAEEAPSVSTPPRSRPMALVGEQRLPEILAQTSQLPQQPPPKTTSTSASSPVSATIQKDLAFHKEVIHREAWKAGVMGAINVVTALLAVRLILLVSVCGAIGLAYLALAHSDPYQLGALAIYSAAVVVPLIWLSSRH